MSDIDAAIAQAAQVPMQGIDGTFDATGRPFRCIVPEDMTLPEAVALAKLVLDLPPRLAARKGPRLVIPTPVIPRQ